MKIHGDRLPSRHLIIDLLFLSGTQLTLLLAISMAAAPWVYFALYVAPLLTLTSAFEAFRSFSEHVLPGDAPTSEAERHRLLSRPISGAGVAYPRST